MGHLHSTAATGYNSAMRWLLFVMFLPGCSFAFVHGPPENHQKLQYFDCDSGGSAMTADITGAAWSGITTAAALTSDDDGSGEPPPAGVPIVFGAVTAVYLASAVYGGVNRSRCNRAKEELAARISQDYEQHRQRVKELELQVQHTPAPSGCSKDLDCKGERICVATQCVDPPVPSVDASSSDTTPAPAPLPSGSGANKLQPPSVSQDPPPPEPHGNPGSFPPAPGRP